MPPKPRFIIVGTICLRKGHHYLFRAFEMVKKQLPEAELICVGDYKIDFKRQFASSMENCVLLSSMKIGRGALKIRMQEMKHFMLLGRISIL